MRTLPARVRDMSAVALKTRSHGISTLQIPCIVRPPHALMSSRSTSSRELS